MEDGDKNVAIHESGHLFVCVALNLKFDCITIDRKDPPMETRRGLFRPDPPFDYYYYLLSLAGPRCQMEALPSEVGEIQREHLSERLIHFDPEHPRFVPPFYDHTGWQHDICPIYTELYHEVCIPMPEASVGEGMSSTTRLRAVNQADKALKSLFSITNVIDDCKNLACRLEESRRFSEVEIRPWVEDLPSIRSGLACRELQWPSIM